MYKTQCLVAFLALYMGLAYSWDFAVSAKDRLEFYINDTKTITVRLDSQNPSALAYDEVHNTLLYVDKRSGNDVICGYNISFADYKCYMQRSGRDIQGLAFDPITQDLFFTDTKEKSINRLSFQPGSKNNDNGNLLIKMDEGTPTDIAVDSCRGYIYWINTKLSTSTIERARFNGSDREIVMNASYKMDLHSLAIGQQTKKIYWMMPEDDLFTDVYSADLNGRNMENKMQFSIPDVWGAGCIVRTLWQFLMPSIPYSHIYLKVNNTEDEAGIVANNKISEEFEGIQECQSLTSLLPPYKYEGPFCVHGVKVNGESLCKCTPGYTGERCDVSVCENYCLYGRCTFNDEGLPECRCYAGYTGDRCEVNPCHGYCSNNGTCSLNADGDAICHCIDDYAGDRCEVTDCVNYCLQGECRFNGELPECRCNAGYTGDRCEVNPCHGYCSNNGTCSLNADGDAVCQCIDDYAGDRCEVTDCVNYCLQGECRFNGELPECSCNAGYSGARCEVDSCLKYCLNNGSCSLNEKSEPFCQCTDVYEGTRCEAVRNKNTITVEVPSNNAQGNFTVENLLANRRKPATTITIVIEVKPN